MTKLVIFSGTAGLRVSDPFDLWLPSLLSWSQRKAGCQGIVLYMHNVQKYLVLFNVNKCYIDTGMLLSAGLGGRQFLNFATSDNVIPRQRIKTSVTKNSREKNCLSVSKLSFDTIFRRQSSSIKTVSDCLNCCRVCPSSDQISVLNEEQMA